MSELFMRFPEGKAKALTLSYDDGVEQDGRLISIMNKHGLKGTFNLNTGCYAPQGCVYPEGEIYRRMTEREATTLFTGSGQEVAVHGLTHPWLTQLADPVMMRELLKDRENLEMQFHTIVRGLAYPFGDFDDHVVKGAARAGLAYARTALSDHSFRIPQDWHRWTATCHHNDPELKELTRKFVTGKPDREAWLFYLWGHSHEFDENDNWQIMEEFAEETGNREDIWYATNIQICDYVRSWKMLEFSADGSRVRNPSAAALWFLKEDRVFAVSAGCEICCD